MKYIYNILYTFFFIVITACHTTQTGQQLTSKQNHLAIVLYASDSPTDFVHFTTQFTQRLNDEHIFIAYHDHEINKLWLSHSQTQENSGQVEEKIATLTAKLKEYLKKQSKYLPTNYENEFYTTLASAPESVSAHVLTEFFFWASCISIKNGKKNEEFIYSYQQLASLSEKNLLEGELDPNTLKIFQNNIVTTKKSIPVLFKSKCNLYLNGLKVTNSILSVISNTKSVLTASCLEGNYSKIFTPSKINSIVINKYSNPTQTIAAFPPTKTLPQELIISRNVNYVLLIFWSKKQGLVEAKILNAKNLKEISKWHFSIKNKKDYISMGDLLISFLKSSLTRR